MRTSVRCRHGIEWSRNFRGLALGSARGVVPGDLVGQDHGVVVDGVGHQAGDDGRLRRCGLPVPPGTCSKVDPISSTGRHRAGRRTAATYRCPGARPCPKEGVKQGSLGTGALLRAGPSQTVFPSCTPAEPILAAEPRTVAAIPVPGLESVAQVAMDQEFVAVADDGAPRLEQIALQARGDQARYETARAPRRSASPRRSTDRGRVPASSCPGRYPR